MNHKILDSNNVKKYKKDLKLLDPGFLVLDDGTYILLFENDTLLGYALLNKDTLVRVFVKKNERFHSVGTKIVKRVLNYIGEQGYNTLKIENELDDGSQYFFERVGAREKNGKLQFNNLLENQQRKKEGIFSTIVSVVVNLFLGIFKVIFGIMGRSNGLIADGLHSFSDVITSIVVFVSILISNKPSDKDHPHGHGKSESIAGNIIGVVLIITGFELITKNIVLLYQGSEIDIPKIIAIYAVIISIIIKFILYKYKYRIAKKLDNDAILADAKDHIADVFSSIGVLVGLGMAITISPVFDIITGIVVGLIIGKEGFEILSHTSKKLMDEQNLDFIKDIEEMVLEDDEVLNVHDIRMKYSANLIFIAFHMRVKREMTVSESHLIVDRIMRKIKDKYKNVEDITIHVDPCRSKKDNECREEEVKLTNIN
ncbi:MAG: GNAT family N-acetyltransferase [Fusobacteriota bacterium]